MAHIYLAISGMFFRIERHIYDDDDDINGNYFAISAVLISEEEINFTIIDQDLAEPLNADEAIKNAI